jgi:hypothetical protein
MTPFTSVGLPPSTERIRSRMLQTMGQEHNNSNARLDEVSPAADSTDAVQIFVATRSSD